MSMHTSSPFKRFLSDANGTVTVEAVLIFPLMFWLLIFGPVTFDIVRERTAVVRNTYMVAKGISMQKRPTTEVGSTYDGLSDEFLSFYKSAFNELFSGDVTTGLRVSEVKKDPDSGEIQLFWEDTDPDNGFSTTVESKIVDMQNSFPHFTSAECVLMVEGWRDYSSIIQWRFLGYTVGWKDERIYHRAFIRPRYETCIGRPESTT